MKAIKTEDNRYFKSFRKPILSKLEQHVKKNRLTCTKIENDHIVDENLEDWDSKLFKNKIDSSRNESLESYLKRMYGNAIEFEPYDERNIKIGNDLSAEVVKITVPEGLILRNKDGTIKLDPIDNGVEILKVIDKKPPNDMIIINGKKYKIKSNDDKKKEREDIVKSLPKYAKTLCQYPLIKKPSYITQNIECTTIVHNIFQFMVKPTVFKITEQEKLESFQFFTQVSSYTLTEEKRMFYGIKQKIIIPETQFEVKDFKEITLDFAEGILQVKYDDLNSVEYDLYKERTNNNDDGYIYSCYLISRSYQYVLDNIKSLQNTILKDDITQGLYLYKAYFNNLKHKSLTLPPKDLIISSINTLIENIIGPDGLHGDHFYPYFYKINIKKIPLIGYYKKGINDIDIDNKNYVQSLINNSKNIINLYNYGK